MNTLLIKKIKIDNLNKQKGQTLVELAFVLPIILLVLMGIFEFGRIFSTYLILTNASREGARVASVGGTDADITNSVYNTTSTLETARLTITIDPIEGSRSRGLPVTVTTAYNLEIISPFLGAILPNPFPLSSQTVMRIE